MNSSLQLELAERVSHVRVSPDDPRIDRIVDYLRGKGWVKRSVVAAAFDLNDRTMRALKAQCGGLVISSSQRGYRLTLEADAEEVQHAVNEIASRVRELEQYRIDVERVWHGRRPA